MLSPLLRLYSPGSPALGMVRARIRLRLLTSTNINNQDTGQPDLELPLPSLFSGGPRLYQVDN